ncbi:hypothetical protein BDQ17DRAFT_1431247 [Cyathus striatus]|nr:hypothetical protein BDQ17DRAFT_1431247 [Cyathus striatus]
MAFTTWITVFILLVEVFQYSDNSFGVQLASEISWTGKTPLPLGQSWDPHESDKQLFGSQLTIIGFLVDTERLTITMPPGKKHELITHIETFIMPGTIKCSLHEFQHLAGWINWALNVFPLLQPGLCAIYRKISHIDEADSQIYLSNDVCEDLRWLLRHLHIETELLILENIIWDLDCVDTTIHVDVSLTGLGVWDSLLHVGYYYTFLDNILGHDIFVYEVFTVLSALYILPS